MDSPLRSRNVSFVDDTSFASTSFTAAGQRSGNSTTRVICKTLYHTIENFGNKVPVQVAEAIRFKERNASYSVGLSNDGWAWFVIGRRLFIWQASGRKQLLGSLCKELTLPPSDLAHKSSLVSVFNTQGNKLVSCIVVSPEGLIRYWPSIANEAISIEDNAELQGQECESIHCIMPLGFVVSTTTATILLVETNNIAGRHSLFCRPFAVPSGWMGGISRRMTSLFFGGMSSSQNMANKLVKVLVSECVSNPNISTTASSFNVHVVTNSVLQKWQLLSGEQEKLLYECNIQRMVANDFLQIIWNNESDDPIDISFLDIQLTECGGLTNMMMLVSAVNTSVSSNVHYALASVNVGTDKTPSKINRFHPLRNIDFSVFNRDQRPANVKFLMAGQTAYLYNNKVIVCIPVNSRFQEVDIIRIADTRLLEGVIINQVPIFFSRIHGFISLFATDGPSNDLTSTTLESNTSTDLGDNLEPVMPPDQQITFPKDGSDGLKSAFLHYASKRIGQAKAIINQLFPMDAGINPQIDSTLDVVTIKVSTDLINDIPAKDPRWSGERNNDGLSITNITSLQIIMQLKQKQNAWELYLSFLKDIGLWKRFSAVTWNGVTAVTTHVLAEHAEKMVAAIKFRNLQMNKYSEIIDSVINQVVKTNKMAQLPGLTVHDVFYKQVNLMHEGLKQLCSYCYDYAHGMHATQNIVKMISDTNTILLEIINEITTCHALKLDFFAPSPHVIESFGCEILPWTASPGQNGLRDSLLSQINVTRTYGIHSVANIAAKQELLLHLISFITIILEGWETHVNSVQNKPAKYNTLVIKYRNERRSLIQLLVDEGECEEATSLAEKFQEFSILIDIYDKKGDVNKLEYYMDKFREQDFAKFLFSYYIGKKQPGKLLNMFHAHLKYHQMLKDFLVDYPSLGWIQAVFMDDYQLASQTLLGLAFQETQLMRRKKSLLSLGKLAYLASDSDDPATFDRINMELDLIAHHEDLPERVLAMFGQKFEPLRVLLPTDLIKFYICDENMDATELDFSKALDLLNFVTDEEEKYDLKQEIWCKAILRDKWPESEFNVTDVIEYLRKFLFFRIIEVNLNLGKDVTKSILPLDKLLETEELNDLKRNTTFQYLMKIGYEHYLHN